MINQVIKTTALTGLLAFTSSAFADRDPEGFYVWADITDVTPIVSSRYEQVPVESCRIVRAQNNRKQRRTHYRDRAPHRSEQSALPALFGGLIGGAIGNRFGSGNGKKAMTVLGAIAGASIASGGQDRHDDYDERKRYQKSYKHHERQNKRRNKYKSRKVCETNYEIQEFEEVDGYEVTYSYLGHEFERVTEDYPDDRLKLYVTVDPYRSDLI